MAHVAEAMGAGASKPTRRRRYASDRGSHNLPREYQSCSTWPCSFVSNSSTYYVLPQDCCGFYTCPVGYLEWDVQAAAILKEGCFYSFVSVENNTQILFWD